MRPLYCRCGCRREGVGGKGARLGRRDPGVDCLPTTRVLCPTDTGAASGVVVTPPLFTRSPRVDVRLPVDDGSTGGADYFGDPAGPRSMGDRVTGVQGTPPVLRPLWGARSSAPLRWCSRLTSSPTPVGHSAGLVGSLVQQTNPFPLRPYRP